MNPVVKYFNEERTGSLLFIIAGVIVLAITLCFVFGLKTSFGRGVAIPLFLVAVLELGGGIGVFIRSPKDIARVERFVSHEPHNIKVLEIPRMNKVMRNFILFRNVEIVLMIIAVILMFGASDYGFWKGIGIGLLIQTTLVLCLDFFAEWRGDVYLDYLIKFAEKI